MGHKARRMRGFTLIASLLVLVLLSGVAIGLMFLVNSQQHVGSNDTEDNLAYYGAESGMEKLTSDLAALYAANQNPSAAAISNLATMPPNASQVGSMVYTETIAQQLDPTTGQPVEHNTTISTGNEAGLKALTEPMDLTVQATRPGSGASVKMLRTVEVAFIPVFQFGVFCDSDCSYFAGPHFGFAGRIHSNGNLFLAANSGPLVADAKISAFGEIIRDRLANDWTGGGYNGSVFVPNISGGCAPYLPNGSPNPPLGSNCLDLGPDTNNGTNDASWSGGIKPAGAANPNFATNTSGFGSFVTNHLTGAKKLSLPFVQGNNPALGSAAQQVLIIRKYIGTDSTSVANSKLFNKAAIRVLLADTAAGLHPERPALNGDPDDIDLTGGSDPHGYQVALNGGTFTRVAVASAASDPAWAGGAPLPGTLTIPNPPNPNPVGSPTLNWNLINGWIRVEYLDSANPTPQWHGVTREWLKYGFARNTTIPTAPSIPAGQVGSNNVHPNAILLLQEWKGSGSFTDTAANTQFQSEHSWYPINFWDPREGLPRDNNGGLGGNQCTVNGIMNAVELDVGNLNLWLQHIGAYSTGSGNQVNSTVQNGYVLYFSDRRGMKPDPNVAGPPIINGEYGFEDVINSASAGVPDGIPEPITAGYNLDPTNGNSYSPEDVDENGLLDNWGANDVGNGFLVPTATNPYQATNCVTRGAQNIVTGARHVLKLVDGSLGNVPMAPTAPPSGGFTVASENPVYIEGDYNSNAGDPIWSGGSDVAHAAAAIIADSVSLLSNPPVPGNPNGWSDQKSMANSLNLNGRIPVPTYFRTAIAAGKSMNFPHPNGTNADFGTDGGVHNFLRLLENWSGVPLHYEGSLVSLYYSQYATGTFKCCNEVYGAPQRNFYFDLDFLNPNNLPPGTPMLEDVNNLSERQDFTPQ